MPFTLSHAAAALCFRHFKPVWPALVIGTFAPDLQYFVLISDADRSGHHFPDVLLYTIPFALFVLWVFEWIVKGPVIELLPSGLQRRLHDKLAPMSFTGWKRFASIVLWVFVGVATHLVWDQFTHYSTSVTRNWSLLRTVVDVPFLHPMAIYKILQHLSTIGGFLVLCVWCLAWYRRTPPATEMHMRPWPGWVKFTAVAGLTAIAFLAGYPLAMYRLADRVFPISPQVLIATLFVAVAGVFSLELLLYGVAITFNTRLRRLPASRRNAPGH